jgi:hypothetical protein
VRVAVRLVCDNQTTRFATSSIRRLAAAHRGCRTLRSRPDRLPPRRDGSGRRRAPPFEARIAAARAAASSRGRLDTARGHPRPRLRDRFRRSCRPAPRRCARTARSHRHGRDRGFVSGPRTRLTLPAARRSQALPQPPVARLAPKRRPIRAGPAPPRRLPHRRPSSPPLKQAPHRPARCSAIDRPWRFEASSCCGLTGDSSGSFRLVRFQE